MANFFHTIVGKLAILISSVPLMFFGAFLHQPDQPTALMEAPIQVVEPTGSTTIPPAHEVIPNYSIPTSSNDTPAHTTIVENTYVTNMPTTVVREYNSSGGGSGSPGTSLDLFHKQVSKILDSIGENASSVRDDMDVEFADIAESFSTALLTVTGSASVGGNLTIAGMLTADTLAVSDISSGGAVEAPYFAATSSSDYSTFTGGFLSNASSTITSGLFSMNGGASTTNFTVSGTSWLNGGLLALASSTIGNGSQTGGLSISGSATTTGNAYIAGTLSIAAGKLSIDSAGNILNYPGVSQTSRLFLGETSAYSEGLEMKYTSSDARSYINASRRLDITTVNNGNINLLPVGTGNVGVGTTSPWGKLSVTGGGTGTGQAFVVADSANTPRFSILDNGKVGIGTDSPDYYLDVMGAVRFNKNAGGNIGNTVIDALGAGTAARFFGYDGSGNADFLFSANDASYFNGGNFGIGTTSPWRTLSVAGTVGFDGLTGATGAGSLCLDSNKQLVYNSGSDACLSSLRATKHEITDMTLDGLSIVDALQPVSFVYNESDGRVRFGFIAEDTAAVDVHLATYDASTTFSGIDDRAILSVVVKAMKELWAQVQQYFARTETLEGEVEALKIRVGQLESQLGAASVSSGGGSTPESSQETPQQEGNTGTGVAEVEQPLDALVTDEDQTESPDVESGAADAVLSLSVDVLVPAAAR